MITLTLEAYDFAGIVFEIYIEASFNISSEIDIEITSLYLIPSSTSHGISADGYLIHNDGLVKDLVDHIRENKLNFIEECLLDT